MTKDFRKRLIPQLKPLSVEELERGLINGVVVCSMAPDFKTFRRVVEEMRLIKLELLTRNIKVTKESTPLGFSFLFSILEDKKVKSPVTMVIPSVSQLINGPIQPDLPKHGYLSNSGPTIHL